MQCATQGTMPVVTIAGNLKINYALWVVMPIDYNDVLYPIYF
jgi:hypothetical protein